MNIRANSNHREFHKFRKATVGIMYLKHILTYHYVKIYVDNPNNILILTIKSNQLHLFVWMISSINFSHDALASLDINRTKIVFYKFGKHDFGAAVINRGIIMKKSCSEEEIRQKLCFQIRQTRFITQIESDKC